jgi:hypothetical protein
LRLLLFVTFDPTFVAFEAPATVPRSAEHLLDRFIIVMASTEGGAPAPSDTKTPADFLKSIKGKSVVVKLNSGVDYRGELPQFPTI